MFLLTFALGLALAQAPAAPPSLLAPAPPIEAVTPTWWITQAVPMQRWPDGGPTVEELAVGTEVEVVVVDGERTRVRKDLSFGWVPSSAVATTPPADAAAAPPAGG